MGPRHLEVLEALELAGGVAGRAGRGFEIFGQVGLGGVFPDLGFDAAYAAEAPFVVDQSIRQYYGGARMPSARSGQAMGLPHGST